jgi:cellulose synthase/poly-beta-1,6-N-acetylglucosamine synthase-like glycosyltransferase
MELLFWLSAVCAVYCYSFYPLILWASAALFPNNAELRDAIAMPAPSNPGPFTMIVAAYNEETHIQAKIRDTLPALEQSRASEIIVVSDYSTDGTMAAASTLGHVQVRVFSNEGRRGRAGAHNYAIKFAKNDAVVFSDVETRIPLSTISKMVEVLGMDRIGCVNAEIRFAGDGDDKVTNAAGIYWRFELWLRTLETSLSLYSVASGPCMAVRRSLFKDLPLTGDVDFSTPLDVVNQGYLCAHLRGSLAHDVMPANAEGEFKARIRMVSKNFAGTLSRWGLLNVIKRPIYTWAIYSHKIFRWLVPFFLASALLSNVILIGDGWFYSVTLGVQLIFYGMAFAGWIAYRQNRNWRALQGIFGFVLVNIAFAIGVGRAMIGAAPAFYSPTRQSKR